MHGCDSTAHVDAAEYSSNHSHLLPTYDKQGNAGRDNCGHQRQQDRGPVVLHRDRQAEGQHPDVVHGPDTETHRYGPAVQPQEADLSLCGSYPSGKVDGSAPRMQAMPAFSFVETKESGKGESDAKYVYENEDGEVLPLVILL